MEVLKLSNSLQNRKWTLSIISFFENPQTSHPYNKIGFIILSNKSNSSKPKVLSMIARIGYGHLCWREENLSFINNYIIYEL